MLFNLVLTTMCTAMCPIERDGSEQTLQHQCGNHLREARDAKKRYGEDGEPAIHYLPANQAAQRFRE